MRRETQADGQIICSYKDYSYKHSYLVRCKLKVKFNTCEKEFFAKYCNFNCFGGYCVHH